MELLLHRISVPSKTTLKRVYFIYDAHVGAFGCDHDLLEKQVKHVLNDDDGYCVLGGDLCECINKRDRRSDYAGLHPMFKDNCNNLLGEQERYLRNLIKPLADEGKVLANLAGNHEWNLALKDELNITENLCTDLDLPYGGYSCVIVLTFRRNKSDSRNVLIHAHHGKLGGRSKAGKVTALERQSQNVEGMHVLIRGHGHEKVLVPDSRVGIAFANDGKPILRQRKVVLGASGAYLKILEAGTTSYAEVGEYKPTDLGAIYAEIQPFAYEKKNQTQAKIELRDLMV